MLLLLHISSFASYEVTDVQMKQFEAPWQVSKDHPLASWLYSSQGRLLCGLLGIEDGQENRDIMMLHLARLLMFLLMSIHCSISG